MNKKGIIALVAVVVVALVVVIAMFGTMTNGEDKSKLGNTTNEGSGVVAEVTIAPSSTAERVEGYVWDESAKTTMIKLGNAKTVSEVGVEGDGVTLSDNDIIIENGGQYDVTGSLSEGRIIINAKDEEVYLRLNGASISCSTSSAIFGYKATKLYIVLAEGTENTLEDGKTYSFNDDFSVEEELEPNACIYAKMDIQLCGSGKLNVTGNYEQGITGKDSLEIANANIDVVSVGKGILGKDMLATDYATITADTTDDSLHSNGNIYLTGGTYTLSAGDDGIHADAALIADGTVINVLESEEGLEGWQVTLLNSDLDITANDDAINATNSASDEMDFGGMGGNLGNQNVIIQGEQEVPGMGEMPDMGEVPDMGEMPEGMEIPEGGMGPGGNMGGFGGNMDGSFEFESQVTPRTDEASLMSYDASPVEAAETDGTSTDAEIFVKFMNSNVVINAGGDGIDSNGSVYMDGGMVVVYGPENSGNGGLDYATSFELVSGTLLVLDVAGMNMTPNVCSIPGIDTNLGSYLTSGDVICVSSDNYEYYIPVVKNCNHITLVSSDMEEGDEVSVITGGNYDGSISVPIETSGSYEGGSEVVSLTLTSGISGNGMNGMNGMGGMGGQGGFGGGKGGRW